MTLMTQASENWMRERRRSLVNFTRTLNSPDPIKPGLAVVKAVHCLDKDGL